MKRPRTRYVVTAVIAAVALTVGVGWGIWGGSSAKDRIQADPPPRLFAARTVAPLASDIAAQESEARARMAPWWKVHGKVRDDKAFTAWLVHHAPAPPSTEERQQELKTLETVAARRTRSGVTASDWLERNGKKDIWKLYAHDQAEWLSSAAGDSQKADVKQATKIAKKVADSVNKRYPASAPFVLDTRLRGGIHNVQGKLAGEKRPCPCSYPSKHSIKAAAARTVLTTGSPVRSAEYAWMEGEIDYSRLYMAGHTRSDILSGTMLGDMIGMYVSEARGGRSLWPAG